MRTYLLLKIERNPFLFFCLFNFRLEAHRTSALKPNRSLSCASEIRAKFKSRTNQNKKNYKSHQLICHWNKSVLMFVVDKLFCLPCHSMKTSDSVRELRFSPFSTRKDFFPMNQPINSISNNTKSFEDFYFGKSQ